MKAPKVYAAAFLALVWAPAAWTLGLGEIDLRSALNQPLDARIQLVSPTEEELQALSVSMASPDHFERYGLDRGAIHTRIRFEVVDEGRDSYIQVSTEDPIREPFVSFLVEASWASGRLLREYTLLLDPPTFGPGEAAEAERPVTEGEDWMDEDQAERDPRSVPPDEEERPDGDPAAADRQRDALQPETELGGRYGPVRRNETLWEIADRMRPEGVSINQMMIALFEANPGAFGGNINNLRQGAVLRVPERADLGEVTAGRANQEVGRQNEDWQAGRATQVAETPEREREDELRLVAPGDDDAEAVGVGTDEAEERIAELESELSEVRSQRDRAEDDSEAMSGQISELEGEIDELRRMVELKDEQLASLQQRVRDGDLDEGLDEDTIFADDEEAEEELAALEDAADDAADEDMADEEERLAEREAEEEAAALNDEDEDDDEALAAADSEEAADEPARPQTRFAEEPSILSRVVGAATSPVGLGILGVIVFGAAASMVAVRRRRTAAEEALADEEAFAASSDAADVEDVNLSDDLDDDSQSESSAESADFDDGAASDDVAEAGMAVDDALEEADFHIAYGTYDKAASLLENALGSAPGEPRLHLKLLETQFAASNAAAFVAAASRMRDAVGEGSEEWKQAERMGREIAPNEDLFGGSPASEDSAEDFSPPQPEGLDEESADAGDDGAIDLDLDTDNGADSSAEDVSLGDDSEDDDLSFDLPDTDEDGNDSDGDDSGLGEETTEVLDRAASESSDDGDDFDFPTVDVPPEKVNQAFGTDSQAQFEKAFEELSSHMSEDEAAAKARADQAGKVTPDDAAPVGIDFGDDDDDLLDLGDDGEEGEEIDTKIDLARAYIDMGDGEGARGILEEVMDEGNDDQKKEAQSLMDSI